MAIVGTVQGARIIGSRFAVQQDGRDYRLQIAAHPLTVVGENARHALDVGRGRIALYRVLNQQPRNERATFG